MSMRAHDYLCLVLATLSLLLMTSCDPASPNRVIAGAGGGQVVIDNLLLQSVVSLPFQERIEVVQLADRSVHTLAPAIAYRAPSAYMVSDGRRIMGRDHHTNTIVVQDVASGDVIRFVQGAADPFLVLQSADNGLVAIYRASTTTAIVLDALGGDQQAVDVGLVVSRLILLGDYLFAIGAAPPPNAREQLVALNRRTGDRRVVADGERVVTLTVIGDDVVWAAETTSAVAITTTLRATSLADGTTLELFRFSTPWFEQAEVVAIVKEGVGISRRRAASTDTAELFTFTYQPYAGDAVTLHQDAFSGVSSVTVVDDKIAFIIPFTDALSVFDPATGAMDTIALPLP